jgi:hypothetical protein
LVICWMAVTVAALCAFQAKNLPYIVLLAPSMCLLAALGAPRILDKRVSVAIGLLLLLIATKAWWPARPTAPPLEGAQAMRTYYGFHREAELIAVNTDDEFYSATIPLPRVRYCFVAPSGSLPRAEAHYQSLGIILSADNFIALPTLQPQFESRLREWGGTPEPIGTSITIKTPADLISVIRARPESDFYLPSAWAEVIQAAEPAHRRFAYSSQREFLLSRSATIRSQPFPPIPNPW